MERVLSHVFSSWKESESHGEVIQQFRTLGSNFMLVSPPAGRVTRRGHCSGTVDQFNFILVRLPASGTRVLSVRLRFLEDAKLNLLDEKAIRHCN